ncbi:hypothetical protein [Pseudooceanicola spongiae]|jgi:uncharacterized coiled-coil protein SlyX|uniref:Uncharacterized protein n=1 Tax=Pseudooceanicola spongiae TaxID=2613965 RepID=A0A7L9WL19_9RHOB|nr:hypothetical protein [Pseudooceanicola spongiae]QOL80534.1 hypothetical protein F3W81_06750 [Pseudooceanicola spongiae]
MSDQQRLERIEQTLDKLSDVVVQQARMQEQLVTLFKRMDRYDREQGALAQKYTHDQALLAEKVVLLERLSIGRGIFFRALDKVVWLVVGCLVAAAVALLERPP